LTLAIALRFADNARLGRDMTTCSCPKGMVREALKWDCAVQHMGGSTGVTSTGVTSAGVPMGYRMPVRD
jgi:hypothetical protein